VLQRAILAAGTIAMVAVGPARRLSRLLPSPSMLDQGIVPLEHASSVHPRTSPPIS
jgi:hypothetical protein